MNILIIVGLLAVAVVAILGIVFLARGESRAQRPGPGANTSTPPTAAVTTRLPEIHESAPSLAEAVSAPTPQRSLSPRETSVPTRRPALSLIQLNGQIHELVVELRSLQQQAGEVEQRLQVLTEVAEYLERSQREPVSIEEETIPNPSAETTAEQQP